MMFMKIIFLYITLILFLTGCISLDINQEIKEDGSSEVEIIYDFSALEEQMGSLNEGFSSFDDGTQMNITNEEFLSCDDYTDVLSKTGFSCSIPEKGVLILNGILLIPDQYFIVENTLFETKYEFDLISVFDLLEIISSEEDEQITQDSLGELMPLNPSFTYKIKMPAPIISSEIGNVNGDILRVDIFDLEDFDSAKVVSIKEKNTLYYILGIVSLFIVVIMLVFLKKKKENSNIKVTLSENEIKCRDYILMYKSQFSKESLSKALVESGVNVSEVDIYLNKYY